MHKKERKMQTTTNNNIQGFIQFQRFVLNTTTVNVRYFMVGNFSENLFSGILHGYEGGGEYSEVLVYKNKIIPSWSEKLDEHIEWDDQCKCFEQLSGLSIDDIYSYVEEKISYDKEQCYYIPLEATINEHNLLDTDRLSICSEGFNVTPLDYANTTFENPIEEWNIDELLVLLKNSSKEIITRCIEEHIEDANYLPVDLIINEDSVFEYKVTIEEYENIIGSEDYDKIVGKIISTTYQVSVYDMESDPGTPFEQFTRETEIVSIAEATEYFRKMIYEDESYQGLSLSVDVERV